MTENGNGQKATRKILKRNYAQVAKMMYEVNVRLNTIVYDHDSETEYRALEKVFYAGRNLCDKIQAALDAMDKGV